MTWWQIALAISAGVVPPLSLLGVIGTSWVRNAIRMEIQAAMTELLDGINGTYVRSMDSKVTGAQIEQTLAEIKQDVSRYRDEVADLITVRASLTKARKDFS